MLLNLNILNAFSNRLKGADGMILALTIIALIILFIAAIWLAFKLWRLSKLPNAERPQVVVVEGEVVEGDTTVIVKRKKKKQKKVVIVDEDGEPVEKKENKFVIFWVRLWTRTKLLFKRKEKPVEVVEQADELHIVEVEPEPVVVQQQAPQYTYVQQAPPPKLAAAAAPVVAPFEEGEDFDDEEEDIIEESVEGGVVRYNRSFMAKYIQASNDTKDYYVHLKNRLLSYKRVRSRVSWKRESFNFGRNTVARIVFRGKTLCLCLPLDPAKFAESKYHVEDVSSIALYSDTPCLYRIRNDRRLEYAYELIEMVVSQLGTVVDSARHDEDYYLPYEGIVQLIDKGLVKRIIRRNDSAYIENN